MAPAPPYKRPESVLVVVHTAGGEFLMLRRREPADFWQSVTGSLEWGERPEAAARRELREETGLDEPVIDCHASERFPILPAWRRRYAPGVRENLEHLFALRLPERRPVRLNPDEHHEHRWLPAAEAERLASSWTNRKAIRRLAGKGDQPEGE